MIRDSRLTFGAPVLLNTGAAGDYLLGDVIDLTTTGRDIGAGEGVGDLFLYIAMSAAAVSAGGGTSQFSLATSDSSAMTSPTKIVSTQAYPVASLGANTVLYAVRIPPAVYKRYLGIIQTVGTAAFTAGSVYAFFVEDVNAIRFYNQGFVG